MQRDVNALIQQEWDVLVVGGGIHGAVTAWKAAQAGYRVALIERHDFGAHTSANSLKILHGGLRYLQQLDLPRMRHSIRSRKFYAQFAPHLLQPLSCSIPTKGFGLRSRWAMQMALLINDCVSWDRNQGLPSTAHLPQGNWSANVQSLPPSASCGATGVATWHDYLCLDTERLTLTLLHSAHHHGAHVVNHAELLSVGSIHDGLRQATIVDHLTGKTHILRTRVLVNTRGPWDVTNPDEFSNSNKTRKYAKGVNLILNRSLLENHALGIEGLLPQTVKDKAEKRFFFVVPLRQQTMIGTTYCADNVNANGPTVSRSEIQQLIDCINSIEPSFHIQYQDISMVHAGWLPLSEHNTTKDPAKLLLRHSEISLDPQSTLENPLITVVSVKYTTAPIIAEKVIRLISKQCKIKPPLRKTPVKTLQDQMHATPPFKYDLHERLHATYGSTSHKLIAMIEQNPSLAERIGPEYETTKAEVVFALREEMAFSLSDLVFRRLGMGSIEIPAISWIENLASFVATLENWPHGRDFEEISAIHKHYERLGLQVIPSK